MAPLSPEQAQSARTKFEELKKLTEQRQAVNVELLNKLSRALEKVGIRPGAAAPVAVAGSKPASSSVKRPSLPAGIPDAKRPKLDSETDKKIQDIWRLCGSTVDYLLKKKNAQVFGRPVDPVRDGVPDYLKFILHPMDLGTIKAKLRERRYNDPREFAADMRLVWSNCRTYNQIGTSVRQWGDQLSDDFERKWADYNCEQRWDDLMATRDPQNVSLDRRIASSARQLLQRVNSVQLVQEADPTRAMTSVEKRKLSIALSELQGDQLADVLNIIAENLKDVNPDDDEEIELDVDQLDNTTLWRLREYCDGVANRGAGGGGPGHVVPSKVAPSRAVGGGGGATGAVSRPAHDNGKQQAHTAKPAARTESGSESDRYSAEQDVKGSNMVEQPQSQPNFVKNQRTAIPVDESATAPKDKSAIATDKKSNKDVVLNASAWQDAAEDGAEGGGEGGDGVGGDEDGDDLWDSFRSVAEREKLQKEEEEKRRKELEQERERERLRAVAEARQAKEEEERKMREAEEQAAAEEKRKKDEARAKELEELQMQANTAQVYQPPDAAALGSLDPAGADINDLGLTYKHDEDGDGFED